MVRLNDFAADIHRRMCEDPAFGYSWSERWGATPVLWKVDDIDVLIQAGDYDCSSSTITAWRLALRAAGYNNPLPNATYTGNMYSEFISTGLFEWVSTTHACRGDLYLNEANHVAMCQGGGKLSEFSSNEYGGAYGGRRGDQTGWESHIAGYYSYPWDGCLHYIGNQEIGIKEEVEKLAIEAKDLEQIAFKVWNYKNKKLEKGDAYQLLRDIRDKVVEIDKRVATIEAKIK